MKMNGLFVTIVISMLSANVFASGSDILERLSSVSPDPAIAASAKAGAAISDAKDIPPATLSKEFIAGSYYPVVAGSRYRYQHTSSEFRGKRIVTIEINSITDTANSSVAAATMTVLYYGRTKVYPLIITTTASSVQVSDSIISGARQELALPADPGRSWQDNSDKVMISAQKTVVETAAGKFSGCITVHTLLGGGDGGTADRFYAPGVGLVKEVYTGEDHQDEVVLLDYSL